MSSTAPKERAVAYAPQLTRSSGWQRTRSPFWDLHEVDIPVFSIGSWGKAALHLRGNFEGYRLVRGPKKLLVVGARTFAETQALYGTAAFHEAELLPWYEQHLKGIDSGVMDRPKVRVFKHGRDQIEPLADWPRPDATVADFLLGGANSGAANSLNDGTLVDDLSSVAGGATSWTYPDPLWMAGVTTMKPDGNPDHFARVVTYTTAPFERERHFTGQAVLHLFASSDQTDMDVMVKLSLLLAEGARPRFVKLTQGWLRASHRAEDPALTTEMRPFLKHDREEPIAPGEIHELRIELLPLSVAVEEGGRLRLEISNWESSITEAPMTHWYGKKVGTDTYHHAAAHPSRLRLHEQRN